MPDTVEPTHETLLRLCLAVDPKPWYPRIYADFGCKPRQSRHPLE